MSLCLFAVGCIGNIDDVEHIDHVEPELPGGGSPTVGNDRLPNLRHSAGIRRLSPREYVHSVHALVGVRVDRDSVPPARLSAGHGQIGLAQAVGYDDVDAFYELGAEAANEATNSPESLAMLGFDCGDDDVACRDEWASAFVSRAFREPLSSEDGVRYLGLLEMDKAGASAQERLGTLITAALSSPHFLYRKEIGTADGSVRRLTDFEIASRMSFLLWQAPPDAELLALAEAGELRDADARLAQLDRMMAAVPMQGGPMGFVYDWLGLHHSRAIDSKDASVLSGLAGSVGTSAEASLNEMIVASLLSSEGPGSLMGLLTTDEFYSNESLAPILGTGEGETLEPVRLDAVERLGVLMHPAVLAAHTHESGPSPFTIGKFISESILCRIIPAPPDVPPVEAEDAGDATYRERLEAATSPPVCQGCHAQISPPGFAFLAFDPIGRFDPLDGLGRPLDTSGSLELEGETLAFDNAAEMVDQIAASEQSRRCVARRMFRWTFGRFESERDEALVTELEGVSIATGAAFRELLSSLVSSDEFTQVVTTAPGASL